MEFRPLINVADLPKTKRQSNMVAFARVFMVIMPVLLLVGLYWRLA